MTTNDPFHSWFDALEERHTATLTFQEVRRAVQALSSIYVENRDRIDRGAVLSGAGKRAAFAMFYAPLHFLLVREIVRALDAADRMPPELLDLGCGTGIAGAAWALEAKHPSRLTGIDRNPWALQECKWTYRTLQLRGSARSGDAAVVAIPPDTAVIAAFTVNELDPEVRPRLFGHLRKAAAHGAPVLVIEPIARRLTTWWDEWAKAVVEAGGREDKWRFPVELPERLALMDRAAGLDHRELTGRSLWLPGTRATVAP